MRTYTYVYIYIHALIYDVYHIKYIRMKHYKTTRGLVRNACVHLTASPNVAATAFFSHKHQRFLSIIPWLHANHCIHKPGSFFVPWWWLGVVIISWPPKGCILCLRGPIKMIHGANSSAAIEEWHKGAVKAGLDSVFFFLQVVCHCQSWSSYTIASLEPRYPYVTLVDVYSPQFVLHSMYKKA